MLRPLIVASLITSAFPARAYIVEANFVSKVLSGTYIVFTGDDPEYEGPTDLAGRDIMGNFILSTDSLLPGSPSPAFAEAEIVGLAPTSVVGGNNEETDLLVTLTPTSFTAYMWGRSGEYSNSWLEMNLYASRSGNYFYNWSVNLTGHTVYLYEGIYDYTLADVLFKIDDRAVRVSGLPAIPEPGIWLQMIAGFGAVGLLARQRRAVAA